MKAVLLVALGVVLAGCTAVSEPVQTAVLDAPAAGPALVVHRGGALLPLPDGILAPAFEVFDTGIRRSEPTIGATSDGTLFMSAGGASIARSDDGGRTWRIVAEPTTPLSPKVSLDPWVHVDPLTDRVFNGPLYVACSWLAWSDDKGETWDANPIAGCGFPAHDYQKFSTGPPAAGVTVTGYPNVIYYVYNTFTTDPQRPDPAGGTLVSVSHDGGRTFSLPATAHPGDACGSGYGAPAVVSPDGTAYVGHPTCAGPAVAVSLDSGRTWEAPVVLPQHPIDIVPPADPAIAVDTEGNVYMAYVDGDGLAWFASSRDRAKTWTEPVRLLPPTLRGTSFTLTQAGEPGRVAVATVATTSDASTWPARGDPSEAPDDTVWHLYVTTTENALDAEPTFVTARVTPEDDPVQIGCIWMRGGAVPCRNLADFMGMVQHEGRPIVVYPDGCDKCTSAESSRGAAATVVRMTSGTLLRDPSPGSGSAEGALARLLPR